MSTKRDIRIRVYICYSLIVFFALAIVVKALHVQYIEGPELKKFAKNKYSKLEVLQPERGNIYTEDGRLLSSSVPEFTI